MKKVSLLIILFTCFSCILDSASKAADDNDSVPCPPKRKDDDPYPISKGIIPLLDLCKGEKRNAVCRTGHKSDYMVELWRGHQKQMPPKGKKCPFGWYPVLERWKFELYKSHASFYRFLQTGTQASNGKKLFFFTSFKSLTEETAIWCVSPAYLIYLRERIFRLIAIVRLISRSIKESGKIVKTANLFNKIFSKYCDFPFYVNRIYNEGINEVLYDLESLWIDLFTVEIPPKKPTPNNVFNIAMLGTGLATTSGSGVGGGIELSYSSSELRFAFSGGVATSLDKTKPGLLWNLELRLEYRLDEHFAIGGSLLYLSRDESVNRKVLSVMPALGPSLTISFGHFLVSLELGPGYTIRERDSVVGFQSLLRLGATIF